MKNALGELLNSGLTEDFQDYNLLPLRPALRCSLVGNSPDFCLKHSLVLPLRSGESDFRFREQDIYAINPWKSEAVKEIPEICRWKAENKMEPRDLSLCSLQLQAMATYGPINRMAVIDFHMVSYRLPERKAHSILDVLDRIKDRVFYDQTK